MSNVIPLVCGVVSIAALSAFAGNGAGGAGIVPGATVFSDGFDSVGTFAENWESNSGTRSSGGVVHTDGQLFRWRGKVPAEYVVEADFRVPSDYVRPTVGSHWVGFWIDGQRFQFQPCGAAFVIANGTCSYVEIPGYHIGDRVRLAVEKKRVGSAVKFRFAINGRVIVDFLDNRLPKDEPIGVQGYGTGFEFDNFRISRVRHEGDSNNLAYNGGFEHDEDGVPVYYNWLGEFDWSRPISEYESDYLGRYAADREVRHSGRQSLRVTLSPACPYLTFRPWQVGGVEGSPAVLSVWAKTDLKDGFEVEMSYGSARRTVRVDGDWKRYEVGTTSLPGAGTYSRAGFTIRNPSGVRGHIWFDDLQAETVQMPSGGAFDYARRSYATPFKPSELDRSRFDHAAAAAESADVPGWRHPASRRPGVLGHYDFYMNESEAAWRVTDGKGRTTVITKPLAEIPMGTNSVTFTADGQTYSDTVVKLPYREGATQVNRWTRSFSRDGTNILFTGLCLKPVGSPYDDEGLSYAPQFRLLKEKGFRDVEVLTHLYREKRYPMPGLAKTRACLDAAAANGFRVLNWWGTDALEPEPGGRPNDPNALDLDEVLGFYADYGNILSHCVLDEPELAKPDEWAERRLKAVKARSPYVPVQMNNSVLGIPRRYAHLRTDVLMLDDYLTNKEGREVEDVVGNIDMALEAEEGKPCGIFLVGDNLTLHYRSPTYAEQVAQSWGCLCSGATIVSWYLGFPNLPGSWRAMVDVNRDAQHFAPALLSEEIAGESRSNAAWNDVRHLTRRYRGSWYLFAVNLRARGKKGVTFTLPADAPRSGIVSVYGEGRKLELENGAFTDDFAGHSRHIYQIVDTNHRKR